MEKITVTAPSKISHGSQILTGFLLLKEQGWDVTVIDQTGDAANPYYGLPIVTASYRGKTLIYDLWDGYQAPDAMGYALEHSDFYFKRSFSPEKNAQLFPGFTLYPLGFNYHVTHKDDPINEPKWKAFLKPFLGRAPDKYFTPDKFVGHPRKTDSPKILFLTQLWEHDPSLPDGANAERREINAMRTAILRALKDRYGGQFTGGLRDTALARAQAPDLIVPKEFTERRKYLTLLHASDICIGTMGLHESIGWKTAEYIAAAKAIVNERLHYQVPGDFALGKNYLEFENAEQCLTAVASLAENPDALYAMQQANETYYQNYLRPDVLVKRTLDIIDTAL